MKTIKPFQTFQTIEVIVSPTGETQLETKGFSGAACRGASRFFERALGTTAREDLTAEFHQAQPSDQHHLRQCE